MSNAYKRIQRPRTVAAPGEILVGLQKSEELLAKVDAHFASQNADNHTVLIKGAGTALPQAVALAELVKRSVAGLHQITRLESTDVVDEFEPLEEGLPVKSVSRSVALLEILLSKNKLDVEHPGYQAPLDANTAVVAFTSADVDAARPRRGKGNSKGGRGRKRGPKGKGKGDSKQEEQEK